MSAWIVNKDTIDLLVSAAEWNFRLDSVYHNDKRVSLEDRDALGWALWSENHDSVNFRYNEQTKLPDYTFQRVTEPVSPVVVLKTIDCYEYQSCEHDGWKTSLAHTYVEALRGKLIGMLPGYDGAPWGWERS